MEARSYSIPRSLIDSVMDPDQFHFRPAFSLARVLVRSVRISTLRRGRRKGGGDGAARRLPPPDGIVIAMTVIAGSVCRKKRPLAAARLFYIPPVLRLRALVTALLRRSRARTLPE